MPKYPWNPTHYYDTIPDFLDGIAKYGDAPAIAYYDDDEEEHWISYRTFLREIGILRRSFALHGFTGKRVAIVGENSLEWLKAFFAVVTSGGVAVCVDIEQSEQTLQQMIQFADSEAAIVSPALLPLIRPLFPAEQILLLREEDDEESVPSDLYDSVSNLIEESSSNPDTMTYSVQPSDPAVLVFTSGTTAAPKAVELTHANLMQNLGAGIATAEPGPLVYSGLPFYHAYGLNCGVFAALHVGAKLTIGGDIRTMIDDMYRSGARTVYTVPLIVEVLYRHAMQILREDGKEKEFRAKVSFWKQFGDFGRRICAKKTAALRKQCLGNVQVLVCGGAHLNYEIAHDLEMLGVQILHGYGITECSPLVAVTRNQVYDCRTVGTLLPGYEIRIEDEEILLRGPSVVSHYYHAEEDSAEAFDADGWFHTGDLGVIAPDGTLDIIGRRKNLIVLKNGKKISPERIEQQLRKIAMIKEVEVYGAVSGAAEDDVRPAASIFPDPQMTAGMERYEILAALQKEIDQINETLPAYQQIQMIDIRENPFERTASDKIRRQN